MIENKHKVYYDPSNLEESLSPTKTSLIIPGPPYITIFHKIIQGLPQNLHHPFTWRSGENLPEE